MLGGGGGKGSYQVGVYRALADYGLWDSVRAIAGSSIGAINAVLFASDPPAVCEEAWKEIKLETIFEVDESLMFNKKPGFMSRRDMLRLMDKYVDYEKITRGMPDIWAAISSCDTEGCFKAHYKSLKGMSDGDIKKIVSASSALPVLYESVTYEGREYLDGGLADNIPLKPLYDAGYRNIIVCGLSHDARKKLTGYPGINAIEIYPSVNLGELVDGTLDFSGASFEFRSMLGYRDAMRAFKVHFEKDPDYIAQLELYAANDLADIKTQLSMNRAKQRVTDRMDDLSRMLGRLGIED